jgi:transposase
MGRKKTLSDSSYQEQIANDLKSISESNVVIKLRAIQSSLTHNEAEVAKIFNIARSTLTLWINKYKKYGKEGLKSKQRGHYPSKLSSKEKDVIKEWLITCKDSQGHSVHWTLKRLIKEIKDVFQIEIKQTPLWITLHKMDLVLKKPRPKHHLSDDEAQEAFKKNSKPD